MRIREADVLRAVLDYLAANHIFHLRLNSGMFVLGEGKSRRAFRGVRPGCADVLAVRDEGTPSMAEVAVYWLECKTEKGRQSPAQREFQAEVEKNCMKYAIVRSIEDLKALGL